jgi:peptidoglycan/LPS O-acetylase OafA/YrhL
MLPWIRMGTQALVPSARPLMTMMFHTASDPIFAGCLLALAPRVWPDARWLRQPPGWWVAVAFGHLFLLAQWLRHWLGGYYFSTFGPTLEAASMWMLVTWLVANPGSAFGRVMNAPPITWIGRLSYSLYVWNQPFLTGLNRTWSGQFPLNLLCNVAVAWLSQQLLEKPFVRWRARLRTGDGSEGKR